MLKGKNQTVTQPDADEAKRFWSNIWENACKHRQNTAAEAPQEFLIIVEMIQKACKNTLVANNNNINNNNTFN